MPVYPIARGRSRLMIHRINQDWYQPANIILTSDSELERNKARDSLANSLASVIPVFSEMPFFLNEEFSLVDCCIVPLLWRLPILGVELPKQAKPIFEYADRMFEREAFQASLTDAERAMRS